MVNQEVVNTPVIPIGDEKVNAASSGRKSVLVSGYRSRTFKTALFSIQTVIYLGASITLIFLHAYQEVAWNFTFEREFGSYHASVASWPWYQVWPIFSVTRELYIALWIDAILHASTHTSATEFSDGAPGKQVVAEIGTYWGAEKNDAYWNKVFTTDYGEFKHYYAPTIDRNKYSCTVMGWSSFDRTACRLKGDDETAVDVYGIMDTVLTKMYKLQCQTDVGVDPVPEIAANFDVICKKMVDLDKLGALTGKGFIRLVAKSMGYDDVYINDLERDIGDPYSYTHMSIATATMKFMQTISSEQQEIGTHVTFVPTLRTADTTPAHVKQQIQLETPDEILVTGKLEVYSQSWKYKNLHYVGTLPVLACSEGVCERHVGDFIMDEPSNTVCFPETIMESVRKHRNFQGQYEKLMKEGKNDHAEVCLRMRDKKGTCSYDNFARGTNYMGLCQRERYMEAYDSHVESDWTGYYTTSIKPNSKIYIEIPPVDYITYNPGGNYLIHDRMMVFVDAGGMSYMEYNNRLSLSPIAQWIIFCIIMLIISFRNGSPQLVGQYLYNSVIVELCGCLLWLDYYFAFYANKARKLGAAGMGGSTDVNIDDVVLRFHGIIGYFALCQWGGKFGGGKMTSIVTSTGNTLLSVLVGVFFMIYNQNYIEMPGTTGLTVPKDPGCVNMAALCYYTENKFEIPISGIIAFLIGYVLTTLMRFTLKNAKFAVVKDGSIVPNYFFEKVHDHHDLQCNIIFETDRLLFIEAPTQRYGKELGLSPSQFLVDTGLLALLGYVIVDGRIVRQRDVMTVLFHAITPSIILSDSKLTYTYWLIKDLKPESGKHIAVYTKFTTEANNKEAKIKNWKSIQAIM